MRNCEMRARWGREFGERGFSGGRVKSWRWVVDV